MLESRQVAAADLKAGDLLLLSIHEPPLTRRIRLVLPKDKSGQIRLAMEGVAPKTPPWSIQPEIIVQVVNEPDAS